MIFVLSIVVLKGYGLYIKKMFKEVFNTIMVAVSDNSYDMGKLYAYGATAAGRAVMDRLGMNQVGLVHGGMFYDAELGNIVL